MVVVGSSNNSIVVRSKANVTPIESFKTKYYTNGTLSIAYVNVGLLEPV